MFPRVQNVQGRWEAMSLRSQKWNLHVVEPKAYRLMIASLITILEFLRSRGREVNHAWGNEGVVCVPEK